MLQAHGHSAKRREDKLRLRFLTSSEAPSDSEGGPENTRDYLRENLETTIQLSTLAACPQKRILRNHPHGHRH